MAKINGYPGYDADERYSFRDFTGHSMLSHEGMSGLTIYASCFSQETPDSIIFPPEMTDATFIKCNLSNVVVPAGCVVIDCTQTRYEVQNDGNDWIVDKSGAPTVPVNYKVFEKLGLPIPEPKDIPAEKVAEAVDLRAAAAAMQAEALK